MRGAPANWGETLSWAKVVDLPLTGPWRAGNGGLSLLLLLLLLLTMLLLMLTAECIPSGVLDGEARRVSL